LNRFGFLMMVSAVLMAGCAKIKEPAAPPAERVAERLAVRNESPAAVKRWLVSWGFQPIERTGYGGVWPRTGPCYQTVKGLLSRDKTVTRVCFAGDRYPVVLLRETKGYYWTEVYPNDLSYNLYGPSGLGAISDETVEILKR